MIQRTSGTFWALDWNDLTSFKRTTLAVALRVYDKQAMVEAGQPINGGSGVLEPAHWGAAFISVAWNGP